MRSNPLLGSALALAAGLLLAPTVRAQVEGCPEDNCVESQTSLVFNPQTNMMDAFTSATTDYTTSYWYDLCVNLAAVRLNGPYLINETILLPSLTPSPCITGAVEFDTYGSVPTTPGRQYAAFGLAELHVYFEYDIIVPFPGCGLYCEGYWYDALGYSQIIATQPSSPQWPSIVYTYIYVPVPVPVYSVEIAMSGSAATAWSPPVIYSITPNQWPAGATTTFTISGDGFGYDPDLNIGGTGIVSYTPKCLSAPSVSCNTQIVATVTIDANTPGGSAETITVTAGGLNPSGFLPVPITAQSGQASAQATTQAYNPPVPEIIFNESNIAGQMVAVYVGQRIELTTVVNLPNGAAPSSQTWRRVVQQSGLSGTAVADYAPQQASGTLTTLPSGSACQTLSDSCLTFYWVDAGTWQWQYTYTYANQSRSAVATFNVLGPVSPNITVQTGTSAAVVARDGQQQIPKLILGGVQVPGQTGQVGIMFSAPALPAPGNNGTFIWVQLLKRDRLKYLQNINGIATTMNCLGNPAPPPDMLDTLYPYGLPGGNQFSINRPNDTVTDNPSVSFNTSWGEVARAFQATMYQMWDPTLPTGCVAAHNVGATVATAGTVPSNCTSIPVPLASMSWQFGGDAINTLQVQPPPNGTTWTVSVPCGPGTANACVLVTPGTDPRSSFPTWTGGPAGTTLTCTSQ